jgi:hypothetical protein
MMPTALAQRGAAAGRSRRGGRDEARRDLRPSDGASDARVAESDDRERPSPRSRCTLCGQDPAPQRASAASTRHSFAPDAGFRPCVLCGGARELNRAASDSARAHEVRATWRLPQTAVQPACTLLHADTADEVVHVDSPGLSTSSAAAEQVGNVRDARCTEARYVDRARLLEAAEGTLAVMAAMSARRKERAPGTKPPDFDRARLLEAAQGTMAMRRAVTIACSKAKPPSARQAETRQCAKPPLLDQACVARARNHEVTTRPDIADEPGSLVDGAGAARDDDSAAVTATRSAAASLRQSSPQAPPAFLRDGSTGEAHRDTFTASSAEYYHDDGDSGNDIQASVLQSAPDRRRGDCLFEVGDEILVERRLRWARRMPLAERRARRYSKPQSCVG